MWASSPQVPVEMAEVHTNSVHIADGLAGQKMQEYCIWSKMEMMTYQQVCRHSPAHCRWKWPECE
jgi:hypothetical protein